MLRIFSCCALLLLAGSPSAAQRPPAVITGQVMILDSMRPAAGTLVRITTYNAGVLTDSAGRYRLVVPGARIVDGGEVQIIVARMGIRPEERPIALTSGDTLVMDVGVKTWVSSEGVCYEVGMTATGEPGVTEKLCWLQVHASRTVRRRLPGHRPPAIITGRVMILDSPIRPAVEGLVRIESLGVGTVTDSAGRYRLVIPAGRITDGGSVDVSAIRIGMNQQHRRIALAAGDRLVLDFAGKRWAGPEGRPCNGLVIGYTGAPKDPVLLHKLCVLTVVHGTRGPRAPRPPPEAPQ